VKIDKNTDHKPSLLCFVYDALQDNSDKHMLIMAIVWLYPMHLLFNKAGNVLRRVRVTIIAVETENVLHILSVCL